MTPAQKEAYANARSTDVHLVTLELNHPQFTEPLRVVHDNEVLHAKIEDDSRVFFQPLQFKLQRMPINEEPDPSITISLDNVAGLVNPYLELAAKSGEEATITFRAYLYREYDDQAYDYSIDLVGEPLKLAVRKATATMQNVTITAAYINPANLQFPSRHYTSDFIALL